MQRLDRGSLRNRLDAQRLFGISEGLAAIQGSSVAKGCLSGYACFRSHELGAQRIAAKVDRGEVTAEEDRAMGAVMGLIVGDALGAPLEFCDVCHAGDARTDSIPDVSGFSDTAVWEHPRCNKFELKPGQWTDDGSMALCLADSLLLHGDWNPRDVRHRFILWWTCGYNNAFGFDAPTDHSGVLAPAPATSQAAEGNTDSDSSPSLRHQQLPRKRRHINREGRGSVGLGGNISLSLREFMREGGREGYTKEGDERTSGNGSLMRLAPVPVCFHRDLSRAMEVARLSSLTTHQGIEASDGCRLLTYLIVRAIHEQPTDAQVFLRPDHITTPLTDPSTGNETLPGFDATAVCYSVQCLALARAEERHADNGDLPLEERNWEWTHARYRYAARRAADQPGYVGSYAMDALSMALHCVYTTRSFAGAVLKAANLRGDSDTVAAITGQIAGAIYGITNVPKDWIAAVEK